MASVPKCDSCGELQSNGNVIERVYSSFQIRQTEKKNSDKTDLTIYISIPDQWRDSDLCRNCCREIIAARFAELCAMLAPYQPARVTGFLQNGTAHDEAPLSKEDRKALLGAVRRLLKT